MDTLQVVLLIFLVSFSSVCLGAHSHDDHVDGAYENILNTMKLNHSLGISHENLTTLLKRLGLHDCANKTDHHYKCVTATSLFGLYNISSTKSLEETDFENIATVIVYALLSSEEPHSGEKHNESSRQGVVVYDELLERYETSGLCEQILDRLLKDVNESIGKQLVSRSKCFSTHEILHEMNISDDGEITKVNLPKFTTIVVSKLLEKQCIEVEHKTPLPCTSFFVDKLFKKYAQNNIVNKEKIEELLKKLKIGEDGSDNMETVDSHDDHNHRRRRRYISSKSIPDEKNSLSSYLQEKELGRYRRNAEDHDDHDDEDDHAENTYEKCYSANDLFSIYHVDEKTGFKIEKFGQLTSALVYQIDSDSCVSKLKHAAHSNVTDDKEKWGYGILAVIIISLCSVAGVAIIPFMSTILYKKAVMFLISLAVGTLVGDALLHLLPHSTGFHDHDHNESSSEDDKSFLWKFLVLLAGIYAFFLFETITHLFLTKKVGHSHSVEHTRRHSQFTERGHTHTHTPHEVGEETCPQQGIQPANVVLTNMANLNENGFGEAGITTNNHGDSISNNTEEENTKKKPISSVAWMIIIGDTIHNIADGIVIGVAFSESTFGGISTSIAVFCHELPHELGDFAVLLSAGMSIKQALFANFISACSCFIGLIFGILIGDIENVNSWVFALTAGFFLYIALTDMLPELMHGSDFSEISKCSFFFLQNAGILLGFTIMLLLAYFEEDIQV